jgi:hypothetical protein
MNINERFSKLNNNVIDGFQGMNIRMVKENENIKNILENDKMKLKKEYNEGMEKQRELICDLMERLKAEMNNFNKIQAMRQNWIIAQNDLNKEKIDYLQKHLKN